MRVSENKAYFGSAPGWRNLNVLQNREPRKQGEALEHYGDVWPRLTQRFIMPKDFAAGGRCESGKDSQKGGFATPRRAEKGQDRVGLHRQIDRSNDLNLSAVRLQKTLLNLEGRDNG
jgi:hypothetical protein